MSKGRRTAPDSASVRLCEWRGLNCYRECLVGAALRDRGRLTIPGGSGKLETERMPLRRREREFMRLRNITGSREVIAASRYVIPEERQPECPGTWKEIFGNDRPIHLEIGMGKGRFIHTMAREHPEINYVGVEKYSAVLLRAVQKMEREELPNLKFLRMDAENITSVFGPGEVDRIYLNFSDPWPKDRHAKRRLPSREFLARYDVILKGDGRLEFKTDNRRLFDFAVEELAPAGWRAERITYDLHGDTEQMKGNVMTEYEEKFSAMGNPICKYIISRSGFGRRA